MAMCWLKCSERDHFDDLPAGVSRVGHYPHEPGRPAEPGRPGPETESDRSNERPLMRSLTDLHSRSVNLVFRVPGRHPLPSLLNFSLLAASVVAAGHTCLSLVFAIADPGEQRVSAILGILGLTLMIPWSLGMWWISARVLLTTGQERIARWALLLSCSVTVLLIVAAEVMNCYPSTSCSEAGWAGWFPSITRLLGNPTHRPLVFMVLVPVTIGAWLLASLPSFVHSEGHRELVWRGYAATAIVCANFAFVERDSSVPLRQREFFLEVHRGAFVTIGLVSGTALLLLAFSLWLGARRASPALGGGLRALEVVLVPAVTLLAALTSFARLFGDPAWIAYLLGYFVFVIPGSALLVLFQDYVLVGGYEYLPTVMGANNNPAKLQEVLRVALGDSGLRLAFLVDLDEELTFVDVVGRPVEPLDAHSPHTREVRSGGKTLAAFLWSGSEREVPERTAAFLGVASLAIERAHLQANLLAQRFALTESRRRLLEEADQARRSVEQDLHDGAQQRLAALALTLSMAAARTECAETLALVEQTRADLELAMNDLRDLARGIYPSVLAQSGLRAAVESLCESSPIAVRIEIEDERFDRAIELAAYFLASEGLANATKHSESNLVRVTGTTLENEFVLEVSDNGRGGAAWSAGGSLERLRDRVETLGGNLTLDSSAAGGTCIRGTFPVDSGHRSSLTSIDLRSRSRRQLLGRYSLVEP